MTFITRCTYQTRNLILIFTPHFITFFLKIFKHLYLNIFKMSIQTFSPVYICRWTSLPIHANQKNHTTTKNIVLVLCFVTVLCHIVNIFFMLNTVHHSNKIKVFLYINEEETKPCLKFNNSQLCVTKQYTLFQFSPPKC